MARRRRNTTNNNSSSKTKSKSGVSTSQKPAEVPSLQQKSEHDLEPCVTQPCVLPSWTPWLVSLMTLLFRVYHVTDLSNWWVLHPDEIFQSMEVAHSELYGYGLRPFEFNRPPKGDNLSHYEEREKSLGMYALRSPVQPQFLVLVVWLLHTLGLDVSQPYLIFRVSHVFITSTLPVAVSKFTFYISRNPDVASLAAILTGASAYLNVMGTHTIVNSFVSPAIFTGLAGVVELIQSAQENPKSLESPEISYKQSACLLRDKKTSSYNSFHDSTESSLHGKRFENTEDINVAPCRSQSSQEKGNKELVVDPCANKSGSCDKEQDNYKTENPHQTCMGTKRHSETDSETVEDVFCDRTLPRDSNSQFRYSDQGYISMGSRSGSEDSSSKTASEVSSRNKSTSGKSNNNNSTSALSVNASTSKHCRTIESDMTRTSAFSHQCMAGLPGATCYCNHETDLPSKNKPDAACSGDHKTELPGQNMPVAACSGDHKTELPGQNMPDAACSSDHKTELPGQNMLNIACSSDHKTELPGQNMLDAACSSDHKTELPGQNMPGAACSSDHKTDLPGQNNIMRLSKSWFSGFLLALAVYIRPDATMFVSAILLSRWHQIRVASLLYCACAWSMVLGASAGLIVGAVNDIIFYDDFVLSPVNWFHFNVWNNLASELFGTSGTSFYVNKVFLGDAGMILASIVFLVISTVCIPAIIFAYDKGPLLKTVLRNNSSDPEGDIDYERDIRHSMSKGQHRQLTGSLQQNVVCIIFLTAIYSYFGHKEERFLHDVVCLFLITISDAIIQISDSVYSYNLCHKLSMLLGFTEENSKKKYDYTIVISLFVSVFLLTQTTTFSHSTTAANKQWLFSSSKTGQDTTRCLHFLSRQSDVTGVYIERNFQDTGGYTVLHQNVPLIYLLGQVFVEFTNTSMHREVKPCIINIGNEKIPLARKSHSATYSNKQRECFKGFFSITTVSDLIHKDNTKAVLRKITGIPGLHHKDGDTHHFKVAQTSGEPMQQHQHPHPRYNYAIISAGKPFLSPAFKAVFRTETMWLWRRVGDPKTEAWLQQMSGYRHHVTSPTAHTREPDTAADTSKPINNSNTTLSSSPQSSNKVERNQPSLSQKFDSESTHCDKNVTSTISLLRNPRFFFGNTSCSSSVTLAANNNITSNVNKNSATPGTNTSHSKQKNNTRVETGNGYRKTESETKTNKKDTLRLASFLEYEGEVLKQLGSYWEAYRRFSTLTSVTRGQNQPGKIETKASIIASAAYCLYRMGEVRQMQQLLSWCVTSYSRDQCLDGAKVRVLDLANKR